LHDQTALFKANFSSYTFISSHPLIKLIKGVNIQKLKFKFDGSKSKEALRVQFSLEQQPDRRQEDVRNLTN
jgi:hypothetical protein